LILPIIETELHSSYNHQNNLFRKAKGNLFLKKNPSIFIIVTLHMETKNLATLQSTNPAMLLLNHLQTIANQFVYYSPGLQLLCQYMPLEKN
jgi:hypothetical protein